MQFQGQIEEKGLQREKIEVRMGVELMLVGQTHTRKGITFLDPCFEWVRSAQLLKEQLIVVLLWLNK